MLSCSCRFIVEMAVNGGEAAGLRQVAAMYEQLKAEWNKKSPSLSKCGDVLGKLKVRPGGGCAGTKNPRGAGAVDVSGGRGLQPRSTGRKVVREMGIVLSDSGRLYMAGTGAGVYGAGN